MGRLTRRNEKGEAYVQLYSDPDRVADVIAERAKKEKEVIERLAEYEDLEEKEGWIPITDRLPDNNGTEFDTVLISTVENGVQMGFYDDEDERWWFTCSDGSAWSVTVTAWMPLPEPYKAGEQE